MVVFRGLAQRRGGLALLFHDVNADGRSLARRLDHVGQRKVRLLADANDFPTRRRHAVLRKFLFRGNLVESQPALGHSFAGVGNAAILQDLLHLAVLAKSAVQGDESQLGVVRQDEIGVLDIDFRDDRA